MVSLYHSRNKHDKHHAAFLQKTKSLLIGNKIQLINSTIHDDHSCKANQNPTSFPARPTHPLPTRRSKCQAHVRYLQNVIPTQHAAESIDRSIHLRSVTSIEQQLGRAFP
mmetsp:Transcript_27659/g.42892  ORF Transcript_27659/g.42892 Transcript_27659/m.42892 type:complete len:110 (+) Transcript_27659:228-557(+)